jgi:uncharacterized protein with PQ loop repeat
MNLGSDHLELRKRLYKNLEPYPHPEKLKRYFDRTMFVIGSCAPLALLPQVSQVYVEHHVAGLSIITWCLLGIINTLWAIYGFLHKEKPILIANVGMAFLDFSIVVGILLFR